MARLPKPPAKGEKKDDGPPAKAAFSIPAPSDVPPGLREATKHDAKLVNLDTKTHVDSKGVEHTTHAGNKPQVGPLTIIFASKMGHPPMRFGDHAKQKTKVHAHMRGKGAPHPNALAGQIAKRMALPRAPISPPQEAMSNG